MCNEISHHNCSKQTGQVKRVWFIRAQQTCFVNGIKMQSSVGFFAAPRGKIVNKLDVASTLGNNDLSESHDKKTQHIGTFPKKSFKVKNIKIH